ncbi:MAG: haloacid dehalogenase [Acidiferrobacteraceae bacterium]|nr:haloacid dehalogenase [Acidiferrobacteraceae bacterium]|tara:strand:+ start:27088 stop:27897 length:810 start_codon:yes stop_codon:yes gene_type:complete
MGSFFFESVLFIFTIIPNEFLMRNEFSKYKAVSLDCYGTLIDWENGIWHALKPLMVANRSPRLEKMDLLQQFAQFESKQQRSTPKMRYSEILEIVHRRLASHNKLKTSDVLDKNFGASIFEWEPFSDSQIALKMIKSKFKLIILSNVDIEGFNKSQGKLDVDFDAVYTAEDIGSYKPNLLNFQYLCDHISDRFAFERTEILHVAQSLYHDHEPASKIGLDNVWIDRNNQDEEEPDLSHHNWGATCQVHDKPKINFVFPSMLDLAQAMFR